MVILVIKSWWFGALQVKFQKTTEKIGNGIFHLFGIIGVTEGKVVAVAGNTITEAVHFSSLNGQLILNYKAAHIFFNKWSYLM